jgi:hypothetical protein
MAAVAASKPSSAVKPSDAFITSLRSDIQIIREGIEKLVADISQLGLTCLASAAGPQGAIGMSESDKQLFLLVRQEIVAKESQIVAKENQIATKEQQIVEEQRKQNLEAERDLHLSMTFA